MSNSVLGITSYYAEYNTSKINYSISKTQTFDSVLNQDVSVRKTTKSTVDEYIAKHPKDKPQIDRLLNSGFKVMEQYGKSDAEVDAMSMAEYKEYIYDILDKLPYDLSQMNDIQFIDISEKGWEQMKKDPKYEAWVVGYFKVDRSVHIPFANYPGVESCIHTEHFGASIEEHLGQSYPCSMSTGKEKDSESWWKERQKRHKEYMEHVKKNQEKKRLVQEEYYEKVRQELIAKGSTNLFFEFENDMMGKANVLALGSMFMSTKALL